MDLICRGETCGGLTCVTPFGAEEAYAPCLAECGWPAETKVAKSRRLIQGED